MQQSPLPFDDLPPAAVDVRGASATPSKRAGPLASPALTEKAAPARHWRRDPEAAFEAWMREAKGGRGFKHRSQVVYRAMWHKLLQRAGRDAAFLDTTRLRAFLEQVQERGGTQTSASQQRRYLVLLAAVQDDLVEQGLLTGNAARELLDGAPMIAAAQRRALPVALDAEQEERLCRLLHETATDREVDFGHWRRLRDAALVATFLGGGPKVHEAQSMRLDDVIVEPSGAVMLRMTASGNQERRAPMSSVVQTIILRWTAWLREHDAAADCPLFLSSQDDEAAAPAAAAAPVDFLASLALASPRPMSSAQLWRVVRDSFVECGLDDRLARNGPTVLRNSFAVRQLRLGKPLADVALWLGHREVNSTRVFEKLLVHPGAADVG